MILTNRGYFLAGFTHLEIGLFVLIKRFPDLLLENLMLELILAKDALFSHLKGSAHLTLFKHWVCDVSALDEGWL